MFKTSQIVYLVAVFFLMKHFKLFNMVEKSTKVKDKTYLLGFKFAAIYVGAQLLEKVIIMVTSRFPELDVFGISDIPGIAYLQKLPLIEGHGGDADPLCSRKVLVEGVLTDPTGTCAYDPAAADGAGALTDDAGAICLCDPTSSDDFVITQQDAIDNAGAAGCTTTELTGGICAGANAAVGAAAFTTGGDARQALTCCPSEAVQAFYDARGEAFNTHSLGTDAHGTGGGECSGGTGATYTECVADGGTWSRPAGWATHIETRAAADPTAANRTTLSGRYNTYTVPGTGGGGGNAVVEPFCGPGAGIAAAPGSCSDGVSAEAECVDPATWTPAQEAVPAGTEAVCAAFTSAESCPQECTWNAR
jgi:hypothetical protein